MTALGGGAPREEDELQQRAAALLLTVTPGKMMISGRSFLGKLEWWRKRDETREGAVLEKKQKRSLSVCRVPFARVRAL